jgi:hypothetical protein
VCARVRGAAGAMRGQRNCWFSLRMCAVQELGPYSLWQHHHAYTATCDERGDGTLCSDVVRCERCLRRPSAPGSRLRPQVQAAAAATGQRGAFLGARWRDVGCARW